jgi:hypothetical protein
MLDDKQAVAIAANARQKNVAQPRRSVRDFDRIFSSFFSAHSFTGQAILELGPGQFDFARRVRDQGGVVHAIDNDAAVVELGQHMGFDVTEGNLKQFDPGERRGRYDGIFCKFSINAFWFEPAKLEDHVSGLDAVLKPGGWGWIAPWNGAKKRDRQSPAVIDHLHRHAELFRRCGWTAFELDEQTASYFGISGDVLNHPLFLKNLKAPALDALREQWLGRLCRRMFGVFSR